MPSRSALALPRKPLLAATAAIVVFTSVGSTASGSGPATARAGKANVLPGCSTFGVVTACPTLNQVKVSFTTSSPTTASVETSVDMGYEETVLDKRLKKVHTITIPETPATTYHIKVTAIPSKGSPSTWAGSFSTGAIG